MSTYGVRSGPYHRGNLKADLLATGLATKATKDNIERVVKYALRLPAEFQVLLMKDAITRDNELTQTKSFNEWAIKNADVMF